MAEDAVGLHRIAAAYGNAGELDLHEVAVLRRAAFDRNEGGSVVAHFFDGLIHLRVAGFDRVHGDFQIFVIAELEFGQDFKDGAELQRLAFLELDLVDFRTRYRDEFLFVEGLLEVLGDERLNHFALNVIGEPAADQRDGSFAGAKSGNPGDAREVACDFVGSFLNVLGRNFQLEFALACCFCH